MSREDEVPEMYFDASCVEPKEANELMEKDDEPVEMSLDEQQQRLMSPRDSDDEPSLTAAELASLDELAEDVEIQRLKGLGVLLSPSHLDGVPPSDVKRLSTRTVHDWREKTHKRVNIWLRRARYVAREYNWMSQ